MNPKYLLPAILFILVIIYASSQPDRSNDTGTSVTRQVMFNLAHIPEYAVFCFLWIRAIPKTTELKKYSLILIVFLILFAVSDEIHQFFVPGRTASIMDIGLDAAGIYLGFILNAKIGHG